MNWRSPEDQSEFKVGLISLMLQTVGCSWQGGRGRTGGREQVIGCNVKGQGAERWVIYTLWRAHDAKG